MGLFQDTLKDLHDSLGFPVGLNECVAQTNAVVDLMGQASDPLGQFSFYIFVGFADNLCLLRCFSHGVYQFSL